jgi:hypothetical protein
MATRVLPAAAGFVLAALLIAAGSIWLLIDDDSAGSERGASIDEIVGAPAEWAGREVVVSGRIISVYPRAFTVGTRNAELLVVLPEGAAAQPFGPDDIGARLRLRGAVERFDEQVELAPGEGDEPRQGDALLRARAVQRLGQDG